MYSHEHAFSPLGHLPTRVCGSSVCDLRGAVPFLLGIVFDCLNIPRLTRSIVDGCLAGPCFLVAVSVCASFAHGQALSTVRTRVWTCWVVIRVCLPFTGESCVCGPHFPTPSPTLGIGSWWWASWLFWSLCDAASLWFQFTFP